jgi:hypothetical protein
MMTEEQKKLLDQEIEEHEQKLDPCYHDLRNAYAAMTQLKRSISLLYPDKLPRNQERLNELRDAYFAQAQHLLDGPRSDHLAEEASFFVRPSTEEVGA